MSEAQYLALLNQVMTEGEDREDRTGVGTRSIFGAQLRFDLRKGFPALTTKRLYWHGVVTELLWFLSGSVRVSNLRDNKVRFWNEWEREDGTIGEGYGRQFTNIEYYKEVTPRIFQKPTELAPGYGKRPGRTVCGVGFYGDADKKAPHYQMLVNVWRDMMKRCYSEGSRSYPGYGAKGVHISERWHNFENFYKDAQKLPGWPSKLARPNEYEIDKDILAASNCYHRETCKWASKEEQAANLSNSKYFTAVDVTGSTHHFESIGAMRRLHGVNLSAVHRCLNGELLTHHGWHDFKYKDQPAHGKKLVYRVVNQMKDLVDGIKYDPKSRRHIVSLWNAHDIQDMELPCCHGNMIQFYVSGDGHLDCQMYQRSGDLFLGVPVNIASYALLMHILAHLTELTPRYFIHTMGDAHIYKNHFDQVRTQFDREPRKLPTLAFSPRAESGKTIDDFVLGQVESEDFILHDYNPHPTIKAEVAV
jgi:thymidylate synthase